MLLNKITNNRLVLECDRYGTKIAYGEKLKLQLILKLDVLTT